MKTIYLGNDHAGFELKQKIKIYFDQQKINYQDLGNLIYDKNDDYPDFAAPVAQATVKNNARGIIICGTSHGACIVANKIKGSRAVSVTSVADAKLVREHNHANIICLAGGGLKKKIRGVGMSWDLTKKIIQTWLKTKPSTAVRHVRRLRKIKKIESKKFK